MSNTIKFAVIGAGAGGQAMAADLSLKGYSVNLFNRNKKRIEVIKRKGLIRVEGTIRGKAKLCKITTKIEKVLKNVDVIIVAVPAFAHKEIANLCAPFLKDNQVILLMPGRTWGAIEFSWTLRNLGIKKEVIIGETQTILHTCVSLEDCTGVKIFALKKKVPVATFPVKYLKKVLQILKPIFSQLVSADSVLETSLGNVGCIIHPAPTLLNTGWIENLSTKFRYYYDGITPSITKFLEEMDRERLTLAKHLDARITSFASWLKEVYVVKGDNLYKILHGVKPYRDIFAPGSLNHRFIYEDVPTGLVPLSSLGKNLGIETPTIDFTIDLANKICGVDFREKGRALEKLGIGNLNKETIKKFAKYGYQDN